VVYKAQCVIDNSLRKTFLTEYQSICCYLSKKFPEQIDYLKQIPVYIATQAIMNKNGWQGVGGLYIRPLKCILIKENVDDDNAQNGESKLLELLYVRDSSKCTEEDVIVHEFLHAVSHSINRSSSYYKNMEEEFVYTNCIEFYLNKNLSIRDIIRYNFFPFFAQDILSSYESMCQISLKAGVDFSEAKLMTNEQYASFLDSHAESFASQIKKEAYHRAIGMVKLYNKFGKKMYNVTGGQTVDDISSARFASLDLG